MYLKSISVLFDHNVCDHRILPMFNTDKLFQALKRITELEWLYQKENDTVKKLTQQIYLANKKHAAEMMSLKGDIKVCKNDRDRFSQGMQTTAQQRSQATALLDKRYEEIAQRRNRNPFQRQGSSTFGNW